MVDINVAMQEVNQAEGVSFRAVEPESPFVVQKDAFRFYQQIENKL